MNKTTRNSKGQFAHRITLLEAILSLSLLFAVSYLLIITIHNNRINHSIKVTHSSPDLRLDKESLNAYAKIIKEKQDIIDKAQTSLALVDRLASLNADPILLDATSKACHKRFKDQATIVQCQFDLVGIVFAEHYSIKEYQSVVSYDRCLTVGDSGHSFGCFQIHRGWHPEITPDQANDPYWASDWTLARLIANGYPRMRSRAIRKHNGNPNNPLTAIYLNKVNCIAQ